MRVIKHIEIGFKDFDLTSWGCDMEDFPEGYNKKVAKEEIENYFCGNCNYTELFEKMYIKKIWFEKEEE